MRDEAMNAICVLAYQSVDSANSCDALLAFWTVCYVGLLLAAGVLPLFAFIALLRAAGMLMADRRDRRPPPWMECRTCGYNLIASRVRCPECGSIIPVRTARLRMRVVRGFVIVERGRAQPDQR